METMLLKIFCFLIIVSNAQAKDELLEILHGVHGLNGVTICMDKGVKCEGALWRRQWVLARASCVADWPLYKAGVLRNALTETCEDYNPDWLNVRKLRHRSIHPSYNAASGTISKYDLAVLSVEIPYADLDPVANTTAAHILLWPYEIWMNNAIQQYNQELTRYISPYGRKSGVFASPVRMFIATVVLPSAAFIAFFLFVTFCTGTKTKIPYRIHQNEKESSSV